MKRVFTLLAMLPFLIAPCASQVFHLAGVTAEGAANASGAAFVIESEGANFTLLHSFDPASGINLWGSPMEGSDGRIYGMTYAGGAYNLGAVFSVNKDGTDFLQLHSFDGETGSQPYTVQLLEGTDGKLYGTTGTGGASDAGVVFRLDKDGAGYEVLHEFNLADGRDASAALKEGTDGYLYGTTVKGGAGDAGVLFRLSKNGTDFTVLHQFSTTKNPQGFILEGSDGKIYGSTDHGGPTDNGTVYRIEKDGTSFEVVASFTTALPSGIRPIGGLIEATDGKLYGTTWISDLSFFNGGVFRLNKDGSDFNAIHSFDQTNGGSIGGGINVIQADNGDLYGMTYDGGQNDLGVIYRMALDGSSFLVLKHFDAASGGYPFGNLIQASDGNLYGFNDGVTGKGSLFRIQPDGTGFSTLHNFGSNQGGQKPVGSFSRQAGGVLFGVANDGGEHGQGVIYRLKEDGSGFEPIYQFIGEAAGGHPIGKPLLSADGKLYGMTSIGGAFQNGLTYCVNTDGSNYQVLHSFDNMTGIEPIGSLLEGADGRLYGVVGNDMANTNLKATLFAMNKDGSGFTAIRKFTPLDGSQLTGDLTQLPDGFLYGIAGWGGTSTSAYFGDIFRLKPDGSEFSVLHSFDLTNGGRPDGSLLFGSDGKLYGVAEGGTNENGVVFSIYPDGSNYSVLHHFDDANGDTPQHGLTEGLDGKLYGVTVAGGAFGGGVLFRLEKDGSNFSKLYDFSGSPNSGWEPSGKLIVLEAPLPSSISSWQNSGLLKVFPNPGLGNFTFQIGENADAGAPLHARVMNASGKVLLEMESTLTTFTESFDRLAEGWNSGIYLVEVRFGNAVFANKLVLLPK